MDIRIFCPSFRRAYGTITDKEYPFVTFVVASFEADEYRNQGLKVLECPDEVQGNIARVRNWILDNNEDADMVVIMDDDISNLTYYDEQKLYEMNELEVLEFFEEVLILLEDSGYYYGGLQVNTDKGAYREHSPFNFIAYIPSPVQFFRKGNALRHDEEIPLKEDYDMTLQQLYRYGGVLRMNKYSRICKQASNTGGCSLYRNSDEELSQLKTLQRKWGRDVVKMDSRSKKGFDFNPVLKFNKILKGM